MQADAYRASRRQNWFAIGFATPLMMLSYFSYAAAFVEDASGVRTLDEPYAALGLAVAPFVFVVLGFVSKNPRAPRHIVRAMLLLLAVGLPIGLIDPLVGAAAGFAAGGAAALRRPGVPRAMRWRIGAVVFTALYCLVLLVVAGPAGVFSGGVIPLIMIGFADEYAVSTAADRADT